ncbi:sigma-70 family RNA polymerase sigma factor [Streptomyces sp. NRRL S-340]|uniref:sigma-70 family RNA polymerase sigma factor n=1 Tax=Streptomyces sp. NRRL S-340 TaxID=1463901 RepID=UPI00055F6866|nr:sigma-70 family RNA polymerase sigma factor [Streptomyces sp. NRRL S-340]
MSTPHPVDPAALVALVTAAREGDPAAQDTLVGAYLPLAYNVVGRALNGSVDVDDVVQDTMLRALDGLDSLRDPASFRSWLVAIAMNRVRAHWQDRQAAPHAVEDAGEVADPGGDFVDLTMVRLQLSGQRQETARATRWLEPDDRALLSLWWLECAGELTRAEVAAALRLSPQHTAVRVQRMKAQLEAARVVVRALDSRPRCAELNGVLAAGWDGRPSALWRKRIARHARACVHCAGLWSGLMPAEGLLAGLALVPVPVALLSHLRPGFDGAPAGSASAPGPEAAAGSARSGGRAAARDAARRRRRARRRTAGAVAVAVCAAGTGLWYFGGGPCTGPHEAETAARTPVTPVTDLAAPATSRVPAASPSATSSASPSASAPPSKSPSASKSPRTHRSTPPAAPTRQPRPTHTAPAGHPAPPAPAGTVAQVVALVNKERANAGCGPLTEDPRLDAAAQGLSDDMAARDFFDHTDPDGKDPGRRITAAGYRWSTYGENIARGQQTPASVMDSWMHSPGHRANILNCSFKNIGVGVRKGSGGPWWTQDFGAKM